MKLTGNEMGSFSYVAPWAKKRSTSRLQTALRTAESAECHCDSYVGFECGIHRRREELQRALACRLALQEVRDGKN